MATVRKAKYIYKDGTYFEVGGGDDSAIEAEIAAINKRGIYYGECSSAADAVAKTVTLDNGADFTLTKGVAITVKFTNVNSASSPTLDVNGTGAKDIMLHGTTRVGTNKDVNAWQAGAICLFIYDGTNWVRSWWYNTTYSLPGLGCAYGTCETAAATAAKVVAISNYKLVTGGLVSIVFNEAVPANATLNINSQGAKEIHINNRKIKAGEILAYDRVLLVYSGLYYWVLAIDRASTWTLMWTNASPGSNFAAQTVSLSLSRYSEVMVVAFENKTGTAAGSDVISAIAKIDGLEYPLVWFGTFASAAAIDVLRRFFTPKSTGITFSAAKIKNTNSTSSVGDNNARVIPYKIYAR